MTFIELANSSLMYLLCCGVLLLVVLILLNFMRLACKRAKEIGISKERVLTTIKTTILVSIGPAFSIVVPFLAMLLLLGVPWSWLRLSVIGSASFEMMLVNNAMVGAGYQALGVETSTQAWGLAALSIALCTTPQILLNIFFNKKYSSGLEKAKQSKNATLVSIALAALFGGLMTSMFVTNLVNSVTMKTPVPVAVLLTTLVIAGIGNALIKKYNLTKLKEFSFAIYILLGMASAILWTAIF